MGLEREIAIKLYNILPTNLGRKSRDFSGPDFFYVTSLAEF